MDPTVCIGRPRDLNYAYVKCIGRSAVCAKIEPSPALREYIDYIWYLNWPWSSARSSIDRFVPTGRFEMVFNLGDTVYESFAGKNWIQRPKISITAPREKFVLINPEGKFMAVGVVFKAGKINSFMECRPSLSASQKFISNKLLHKDPIPVFESLKGESSIMQKMQIVNQYLSDCLIEERSHSCFVDFATNRILSSRGNITVREISETVNCSERHLHRKFKERVGINPKKFTQIVKINSIIEQIFEGNGNLSELAYDHGFFDQTHFNKTFKRLVGVSPKQFLNGFRGFSQLLQFNEHSLLKSA